MATPNDKRKSFMTSSAFVTNFKKCASCACFMIYNDVRLTYSILIAVFRMCAGELHEFKNLCLDFFCKMDTVYLKFQNLETYVLQFFAGII